MEKIRQAIERARSTQTPSSAPPPEGPDSARRSTGSAALLQSVSRPAPLEVELDPNHLISRRIVTPNAADARSRPYDILRTQILQAMARNSWKVLGVTSPTPGCGKTVTATNLAFSIARQADQSVVLADLDLRKPQVAASLGLRMSGNGVMDLLAQRATLPKATIPVRAAEQRIVVLPTSSTTESSELLASRAARGLLQNLKAQFQTVILDLPPMLSSDEVIALMPEIDCVLLVAAIGLSKASEVEECIGHVNGAQLVRVVANKTIDETFTSYY